MMTDTSDQHFGINDYVKNAKQLAAAPGKKIEKRLSNNCSYKVAIKKQESDNSITNETPSNSSLLLGGTSQIDVGLQSTLRKSDFDSCPLTPSAAEPNTSPSPRQGVDLMSPSKLAMANFKIKLLRMDSVDLKSSRGELKSIEANQDLMTDFAPMSPLKWR